MSKTKYTKMIIHIYHSKRKKQSKYHSVGEQFNCNTLLPWGIIQPLKKEWTTAPPSELEESKEKHQVAETCI